MREKEIPPKMIHEYSTWNGKASVKLECMNPKLITDYNTYFIEKYESIFFNLRMSTVQIQESSWSLADSIQEFSRNIMLLSDLYSDCGFDEFNDLLQAVSSLTTGYQHQISEQANSI